MTRQRASLRRTIIAAAVLLAVATPGLATAEFYTWTSAAGERRVSNIPPAGVRADGSVRGNYHPYSVGAQHSRMRAELEREAAALAEVEAERTRAAAPRSPLALDLFDATTAPASSAEHGDR